MWHQSILLSREWIRKSSFAKYGDNRLQPAHAVLALTWRRFSLMHGNKNIRNWLLTFVMSVGLAITGPARGDQVVQSISANSGSMLISMQVQPFDSSLGQLEQVDLGLSVSMNGILDVSTLHDVALADGVPIPIVWMIANTFIPVTPGQFLTLPFPIRNAFLTQVYPFDSAEYDSYNFSTSYSLGITVPSTGSPTLVAFSGANLSSDIDLLVPNSSLAAWIGLPGSPTSTMFFEQYKEYTSPPNSFSMDSLRSVVDLTITYTYSPDGESIPEPATLMLIGVGLASLAGVRRRKV